MKKLLLIALCLVPLASFAGLNKWDHKGDKKFKKIYIRDAYSYVPGDSLTDSTTVHTYLKSKGFIGPIYIPAGDTIFANNFKAASGDSIFFHSHVVLHHNVYLDSTFYFQYKAALDSLIANKNSNIYVLDDITMADTTYIEWDTTSLFTEISIVDASWRCIFDSAGSKQLYSQFTVTDDRFCGTYYDAVSAPYTATAIARSVLGVDLSSISADYVGTKLILNQNTNDATTADSVFVIPNSNNTIEKEDYDSLTASSRVFLTTINGGTTDNDTIAIPESLITPGGWLWIGFKNTDEVVPGSSPNYDWDGWNNSAPSKLRVRTMASYLKIAPDTTLMENTVIKGKEFWGLGTNSVFNSLTINSGVSVPRVVAPSGSNLSLGNGPYLKLDDSTVVGIDTVTELGRRNYQWKEVWARKFIGTDPTKADSFRVYDDGTNTIFNADNPTKYENEVLLTDTLRIDFGLGDIARFWMKDGGGGTDTLVIDGVILKSN